MGRARKHGERFPGGKSQAWPGRRCREASSPMRWSESDDVGVARTIGELKRMSSPHGRTRMIVFPLRRSVELKAATASSRVETFADVRPQSSVTRPLDNLTQLSAIGYDDEVNRPAVSGPCLGRVTHGRAGQGVDDRGVELRNDRLRRALGRPNPAPVREVKSGQSCLVHGRDIRRGCKAGRVGRGVCLDVSRAQLRLGIGRDRHCPVDASRHAARHGVLPPSLLSRQ